MAEETLDRETFFCSVCLDLMKDPVTIPCGHSYCLDCIKQRWDQEEEKKLYSCPQCQQTFSPRPVLISSLILAALVKQLKQTGISAASMCSEHRKVMDLFCVSDQQSLCRVCHLNNHQLCIILPLEGERERRKGKVMIRKSLILYHLNDKETDLKRLQQEAQDIRRSAKTAVQRSADSFREMALLLDKKRSEVEKQIRSQEKIQLSRIQELQDRLRQEVKELKKGLSDLDALASTADHNQFIQEYDSLPIPTLSTESARIQTKIDFEEVTRAVSALRDKLQLFLDQDITNVSLALSPVQVSLPPEHPKTREDFLQYYKHITLDTNTANSYLILSDGNRRVTMVHKQIYPKHPDRFSFHTQVLSRETLTGRTYLEAEWNHYAYVALAYHDIQRKGKSQNCKFGFKNTKSWALSCSRSDPALWFCDGKFEMAYPMTPRVGIYVDLGDSGDSLLEFYNVSAKGMSLFYRGVFNFTRPLHVGVWLSRTGTSVFFPDLSKDSALPN